MTNDHTTMILFGVRYCLTRRTYAPDLCCEYLRKHWDEFTPGDQGVILKDIRNELDMGDREMHVSGQRTMPDDIREAWASFVMWADDRPVNLAVYREAVRTAWSTLSPAGVPHE